MPIREYTVALLLSVWKELRKKARKSDNETVWTNATVPDNFDNNIVIFNT